MKIYDVFTSAETLAELNTATAPGWNQCVVVFQNDSSTPLAHQIEASMLCLPCMIPAYNVLYIIMIIIKYVLIVRGNSFLRGIYANTLIINNDDSGSLQLTHVYCESSWNLKYVYFSSK